MEKIYFSKIYTRCRRGILELDIILLNFVKNIPNMDINKYKSLIEFLDESDVNLYDWLIKNKKSPKKFLNLVNEINNITKLTLLK